jgi:N-acetylglucosaminyldiphosphoundecaprenol N-acetyl-beta-D-mannosaminyltransferase
MNVVSVLGVRIANCSRAEAIELLERVLCTTERGARSIFIANAHTLNLAAEDRRYLEVLNGAYRVFADGTGVRWAARLQGIRLKENLVGTDLIPELFLATAGRGFRYFLLGSDADTIRRAAAACAKANRGWDLAGFHQGYIATDELPAVIAKINASRAHLLLVGMGNPIQEYWIHHHRHALDIPVCVGVGGLFDHWGGNLERAPLWIRGHGFEWLHILFQQPNKWRRYLVGNPRFLYRVLRELLAHRRMSTS